MRVAVVGAGGIGGFLAAALARAGVPVGVVARAEHLAAIRADGLRVESDLGNFTVRLEASEDLRDFGPIDVILCTFKSHQWPKLVEQFGERAHGDATIVTLQNGLPFWYVRDPPLQSVDPGGRVASFFADERIVGGVVHVSGHIAAPGFVRQSGGTRYVLGPPGGDASARAKALVDLLRGAGLAAEHDAAIRTTVWLKLVNNAGLNPVSALRAMTIATMLANPSARAEVRALMEETLHVGQALGVVCDVDIDERIAYASRLDDVKTSMLQDRERGRPLELDPILGAVLELARRCNVETPHVRAAYEALRG